MKKFLYLWLATLLAKFILAAIIPLSLDEIYYWVWSQNLQLSYYDHPPMVAWLLKVGSLFQSLGHAVRWPSVFLGHLTMAVWYLLIKEHAQTEKARAWFFLVLCSPLIGFGSLIATPDVPVIFFISTATYSIIRYLKKPNLIWASALGISLGLGFCSKYHIVLFPLFAVIYLMRTSSWKLIRIKDLLASLLFFFIFSAPVWIWNAQNEWTSFLFQIHHGLGREKWDISWTLTYPLGQILALFPVAVYFAWKAKPQGHLKILKDLAWGPLLFFLISSFKGKVELNWPIVAYPSLYALSILGSTATRWQSFVKSFWLLLGAIVVFISLNPKVISTPNKLTEYYYHRPVLSVLDKYEPLFGSTYQMASYVWYTTKKPFYKLREMGRIDFFDHLDGSLPVTDSFYVVLEEGSDLPPWIIAEKYKIQPIEKIDPPFVVYKLTKP